MTRFFLPMFYVITRSLIPFRRSWMWFLSCIFLLDLNFELVPIPVRSFSGFRWSSLRGLFWSEVVKIVRYFLQILYCYYCHLSCGAGFLLIRHDLAIKPSTFEHQQCHHTHHSSHAIHNFSICPVSSTKLDRCLRRRKGGKGEKDRLEQRACKGFVTESYWRKIKRPHFNDSAYLFWKKSLKRQYFNVILLDFIRISS